MVFKSRKYSDLGSVDSDANDNSPDDVEEQEPMLDHERPRPRHTVQMSSDVTWIWCILVFVMFLGGAGLLVWHNSLRVSKNQGDSPLAFRFEPTQPSNKAAPWKHVRSQRVHYNPTAGVSTLDPVFDVHADLGSFRNPPNMPPLADTASALGYLQHPHLVNDTLVFCTEGDLYATRIDVSSTLIPWKLTTTVGNVLTPVLHPHGTGVAFTATYTGSRDVYFLNFETRQTQRWTYSDTSVVSVVEWKTPDTLVYAATTNQVSLPDVRLYELHVTTRTQTPVPLAQAMDGVTIGDCLYFVRVQQSSNTMRYVGGTVEALWKYCQDDQEAIPLTLDYNGTSKHPQAYKDDYILFLSDRDTSGHNVATSMNLFAMYIGESSVAEPIVALTRISCDMGMALREYTVDPVTHNVVLRIGADLYHLSAQDIDRTLQQQGRMGNIQKLDIAVYSDFHEHQERRIPLSQMDQDVSVVDVYQTAFGATHALLTVRGQVVVAPVLGQLPQRRYEGGGENLPERGYLVAPSVNLGGAIRILQALHVPLWLEEQITTRRLALLLATDPLSPTAEHAFYLVETQSDSSPAFVDWDDLPVPFLGGHVNGGSTADGGLGSVLDLEVSPCGRRMAWTDTDGRICVKTLPLYQNGTASEEGDYVLLPQVNELGEPMVGTEVDLTWSPGGRYLAVNHHARNQFYIVSIVDLGNPEDGEIQVGRIVQATPDRFNSFDVLWGKTTLEMSLQEESTKLADILGFPMPPETAATTMFFLTDRDVISDVHSPWGTRAPNPHFPTQTSVYALPLLSQEGGRGGAVFTGGGAAELLANQILEEQENLEEMAEDDETKRRKLKKTNPLTAFFGGKMFGKKKRRLQRQAEESADEETASPTMEESGFDIEADLIPAFPQDVEIDFGPPDLSFARRAYRFSGIPVGNYDTILAQTSDDGSLVLAEKNDEGDKVLKIFLADPYPSDRLDAAAVELPGRVLQAVGLSTTRDHIFVIFKPTNTIKVVPATSAGLASLMSDVELDRGIADTGGLALSVWPALEYRQLYSDAWRMLRDYFYDRDMTGIDWPMIHDRYLPLVERCSKREELDDVMAQMASELSALHVFVYGGEYSTPLDRDPYTQAAHTVASLGALLERDAAWKGYRVVSIPEVDPDFDLMDGRPIYSPLSERTLRLSGQRGLEPGDVIVGVNGESVMRVPDINMLLRGTAGRSVRLDVLRLSSGNVTEDDIEEGIVPEPVITVPLSKSNARQLRYDAWEWKTRQLAKQLAEEEGFSVGYIHLRSMSAPVDEDAFARGFYPDYDKQALIVDVRHNLGGSIDWWLLDVLERKAWMYWESRAMNTTNGGLGWDVRFAFRGHIVVLIDEKTSSDGEGFSRGMSELGLGRLIGTRTWGGGIWLASDNILVDGGIASAPEDGTYNDNFGWGLGIEQMGVVPDIVVDNNPRTAFDGKDTQLERAIQELKKWLEEEPVVLPTPPAQKKAMSQPEGDCPAN